MRSYVRWIGAACTLLAGLSFAGIAGATAITMDFNNLGNNQSVDGYYDGGCSTKSNGHAGKCNGPADGVSWSGAQVVKSGSDRYITFGSNPITMSVADGFTNLVFDYTFAGALMGVTFYDGIDGSGNQISSTLLGLFGGCPAGTVMQCHIDITLAAPARSAVFGKFLALGSFDNINVMNVPEPAALGTFGFGLLLIGGLAAWRRREGDAARQAA